ncbi:hypothetical protein [Endozoicomonas acroporae]|uniref:hypothetical protein n=1 Tax=Endozoicomonas acroporae TaxID=1701104 RepID=UPI003D790DB8
MRDVGKNIVIAAISVALTLIGNYFYDSSKNAIKKLDVHTNFDPGYISKPNFPDSKIEFKVDDIEKSTLGRLDISILNYTESNFKDLPIKIKITPKKTNDFKVIAYSVVGEKEHPDLVSKDKDMEFDGTSYFFSYTATTLNREEKTDYGMQLRVLFEGNTEPTIDVIPSGVSTRVFDRDNSPHQKEVTWKAAWLGLGLIALILAVIFIFTWLIVGPVISRLTKKMDVKSRKKYAQDIFNAIKKDNLQPNMSDQELADYVAQVLYNQRQEKWQNMTIIGRWSLGLIEPNRDDYLIEP